MSAERIIARNNVKVSGQGTQPMLFSHGFGCDQNMWCFVAPEFEPDYHVVLFDHVGAGKSDLDAYSPHKYTTLQAYADDVLEICAALDLRDVVFVGHSVSAMIGALAAIKEPGRFDRLVMVGPSPCYMNDGDYHGGFSREDLLELLDSLDDNYLGWSAQMAPVIMGNADRPELGQTLTESFCATRPDIARQFARVTFLSDVRDAVPLLQTPSLLLQCSSDVIAPESVGEYLHQLLPHSHLTVMEATGHCPNLSAPRETIAAMRAWL